MNELQKIIQAAHRNLPVEKKSKPWSFVNHGVALLQNEDELNCYLAAYGNMHQEKIHTALSYLTNLEEVFGKEYQVIDWGCGQGLATLCLVDFLNEKLITNKPKKITLIEPSKAALAKANHYLDLCIGNNIEINLIEKLLNDVNLSDIKITEPITINFFSNILDIESVDLNKIAGLVKANLNAEQYFVCVGPMNANSTRIDEFAKLLNFTEEQILGDETGRLKKTRGTIKLLVFKIVEAKIEIIKSIYYPPMPITNNYIHILQKKLDAIDITKLNQVDRILEYYKLVIELEQIKEPKIDKYYPYPFLINEQNKFEVDLETNINFLNIIRLNKTAQWPKDLIISIELEINFKKHTILSYSYLYADIKDIDTANEKVCFKISDFNLNYSTLTLLEKSNEEIDEIEKLINASKTLEEVLRIFKSITDGEIVFNNELSFALSSKNPALLQIYSELKKLSSKIVTQGSLLYDFLLNNNIENKIATISENDLIQISNLDDSQKRAVLSAFNNKISVITGPPGSGKTQVISNILANAVMQNKKVLVASKNNQAVDNVKNRFDKEEKTGYFLRFGTKEILINTTIHDIQKISISKTNLLDNTIQLEENIVSLYNIIKLKTENTQKLERRDFLRSKLPEFKKYIENLEINLSNLSLNNPDFEKIRLKNKIEIVENYISSSKKKRNYFELKYSGLNKLWIDWFTKKKYAFELISYIDETHKDFKIIFKQIPNQISDFKNGSKILDTYKDILKSLELVTAYYSDYDKIQSEFDLKNKELEKVEAYIKTINANEQEIRKIIDDCEIEIIKQSKVVLKEKIENKLFNASQAQINNYKCFLPDVPTFPPGAVKVFENATKNFLDIFNIISVTSLSAKASLPLTDDLFDMVIIDEASQCDVASAIPLILRAKQLVVIGDPLQLRHITSLNKFEEDKIKEHLNLSSSAYLKYKEKSLWDYSETFLANAINNNLVVDIDSHYRCHRNIIGYSNEFFYKPKRGIDLKFCTNENQFHIESKGMFWEDIKGKLRDKNININDAEVKKCIEIATKVANENPTISIGIVTPFVHQAKEIHNKIPTELSSRIITDTIYKFQGDEKDVMIYSLVVTNKTIAQENVPDSKIYWIDKMAPEQVNVAVTRARSTLYIVGDKDYIRSKSIGLPLGQLLSYAESLEVN